MLTSKILIATLAAVGTAVFCAYGAAPNSRVEPGLATTPSTHAIDWDKVNLLLNEREGLREEMIALQNMMPYVLFYFLAAIASAITVIVRKGSQGQEHTLIRQIVPQVVFFLSLVLLLLSANLQVHAGYVHAIEDRINRMVGENLNCWESQVTAEFVGNWKSAYGMTACVAIVSGVSVFCWVILLKSNTTWVKIIFGAEVLVFVFLLVMVVTERQRVYEHASRVLGM